MKSITQLGTLAGIVVVLGILAMIGGLYQVFAGAGAGGLMGISAGFTCVVMGYAIDALITCAAKLTRLVELMETEKKKTPAQAVASHAKAGEPKSKWILD